MIKKFEILFKSYETYSNKDYLMNKVSARLLSQAANTFIKGLRNKAQNYQGSGSIDLDSSLKDLCNIVCEYTEIEETTNWEWYFLIEDYQAAFQRFLGRPFYKFMDATSKIVLEFLDGEIVRDINLVFAENNFGYRIQNDANLPWLCINPDIQPALEADEAAARKKLCQETIEHITQTKEQLLRAWTESAGKDALQDCLSGMETLLKEVTHSSDITDAMAVMKENSDIWGPEFITGDALALWKLYQVDFGAAGKEKDAPSGPALKQTVYLLDRILIYVHYISGIASK